MTTLQKVFLYIVFGQAVILSASSVIDYRMNQSILRDVFASRTSFTTQTIANELGGLYCQNKFSEVKKLLESYHRDGAFKFAHISYSDNRSFSVGTENYPHLFDADETLKNETLLKAKVFSTFAEVPACNDKNTPGELEIGYGYEELNAPLQSQLNLQMLTFLAQILALFISIYILMKILNTNMQLIIKRCKKIALGDLEEVRLFNKNNDFYIVAETLNSMSHALNLLQKEKENQRAHLVMNSKLTSLGEMAGGVAHEINNPLAVIAGKTMQLKRELNRSGPPSEIIQKSLLSIEAMVERIAKIVRGMRSFSRDGSGDPYQQVLLKTIVDDTIPLCQAKYKNSEINLTITPFDETIKIMCRPTEISQVLLNLLNNACDAVEALADRWVRLDIQTEKDRVMIRVTDSGGGIPLEIQEKILQPFFTTKPVGKGTGLGLSISIGIIKSHQGTLAIDPGNKNTSFIINLPRALPDRVSSIA